MVFGENTKFGFSTVDDLMHDIISFMTATDSGVLGSDYSLETAYFAEESYGDVPPGGTPGSRLRFIRALPAVDAIGIIGDGDNNLNWGLSFEDTGAQLIVSWGRMLGNEAAASGNSEIGNGGIDNRAGNIAVMTAPDSPWDGAGASHPIGGTDGGRDTAVISPTNLHGYSLALTDHGFALAVYSQVDLVDWRDFSLLVIQRPVDSTGAVPAGSDKKPLFVLWNNLDTGTGGSRTSGINTTNGDGDPRWFKGILWEDDVSNSVGSETVEAVPNIPEPVVDDVDPDTDSNFKQVHFESTETLYGWPTTWVQPITQDNNEIPLVFPFGLTTGRFNYLEEMDLVCVGPSCVFTFGQDIDLTVFGGARQYKMLTHSSPCAGVALGILRQIT